MKLSNRDKSKKEQKVIELTEYEILLSKIVIPFGAMFHIEGNSAVYSGSEKIPFKLRDPIFKAIMVSEFETTL